MMAIRYPELVAWSRSWVGVHIPEKSPAYFSAYTGYYGKPSYGVLFENGTPVWDYYNDVWYLRNYPNAEIGFLTFANGKNDSGIGWEQAVEFYEALQETKRPHLFVWGRSGHRERAIMPKTWSENVMPIDIRTDLSLPAFTACSLDDIPGDGDPANGDLKGQINAYLYWETEDIVDTEEKWEMTMVLMEKAPENSCTVDITPRRLQNLKSVAGEEFLWKNIDVASGEVIASGTLVADQYGLLTVEQTAVSKTKNRIVIEKIIQ